MRDVRAADAADLVVRRAFAPCHKRALGLAVGFTAALFTAALTLFHVIVAPPEAPAIGLLAQFFAGYEVSPSGVLVGAWWSFVVGFVAGWFAAFVVNLWVATWLLVIKARHDLGPTTTFLDQI